MTKRSGKHRDANTPSPPTDDEPVLPSTTSDERDVGWGDDAREDRDEAWYRRERPPHHE